MTQAFSSGHRSGLLYYRIKSILSNIIMLKPSQPIMANKCPCFINYANMDKWYRSKVTPLWPQWEEQSTPLLKHISHQHTLPSTASPINILFLPQHSPSIYSSFHSIPHQHTLSSTASPINILFLPQHPPSTYSSFHFHTKSVNAFLPTSCLVLPCIRHSSFSTTTCVAIPAWSQPGFHRTDLPCILCLELHRSDVNDLEIHSILQNKECQLLSSSTKPHHLTIASCMVFPRAWPKWRVPVTLGGGRHITNFSVGELTSWKQTSESETYWYGLLGQNSPCQC